MYREKTPAPILKILDQEPGTTLWGTKLVGREKGEKSWEILAKKIWRSKDNVITICEDIEDAIVYIDGKKVNFSAPRVRLDEVRQMMTLEGGIRGNVDKGYFETNVIHVDLQKRTLKSTSKVKFTYEEGVLTADRMEADLKAEVISLIGNVIGRDGDQVFVGEQIDYSYNDNTYQIHGETEVELEL